MPELVTDEWATEVARLASELPPIPGTSGTISLTVSGARRKETSLHWRYDSGTACKGEQGSKADADLVLTIAAADAVDVISGAVEPSVAFMRGRLKASGNGGLLIGFLASTTAQGYEAWREQVAALTEA
jgi:putative sterol carrier protein